MILEFGEMLRSWSSTNVLHDFRFKLEIQIK